MKGMVRRSEGSAGERLRPPRKEGCWEREWDADREVTGGKTAGEGGRKGVVGSNVILIYEGEERSTF